MLLIIILLLFGAGFTFLSMQNTGVVSLTFMQYQFSDLPLNYVILGSVLFGAVLVYLISFANSIAASIKIRGLRKHLQQAKKEVVALTKKVHQLELENVSLKTEHESDRVDQKSL